MAEDLMKSDGKSAENGSPKLLKDLEEELGRYFDQLDIVFLKLEKDRNNESAS